VEGVMGWWRFLVVDWGIGRCSSVELYDRCGFWRERER
jgi:hypothetical protein